MSSDRQPTTPELIGYQPTKADMDASQLRASDEDSLPATPELVGWTDQNVSPLSGSAGSEPLDNHTQSPQKEVNTGTERVEIPEDVGNTANVAAEVASGEPPVVQDTQQVGEMDRSKPQNRTGCLEACNVGMEDAEGDATSEIVFAVLYVLTYASLQPALLGQLEGRRVDQVGPCNVYYDELGRVSSVLSFTDAVDIKYRCQEPSSGTIHSVTYNDEGAEIDVEGRITMLGPHRVLYAEDMQRVSLFRTFVQYEDGKHKVLQAFGKELSYDANGLLIGIGTSPVYYEGDLSRVSDARPSGPRCVARPGCTIA